MPPKFTPDKITTDAKDVLAKPCDVVAMIGYLAAVDDAENYRLYQDHDFRRWIEIGPDTIKAQSASKDPRTKGQSVVWLDSKVTVKVCEEVPVRAYQPQPRGATGLGREDIASEYPSHASEYPSH
jgi:hypothetical protein